MTLAEFRRLTAELPGNAELIHVAADPVFPYYSVRGIEVKNITRIMGSAFRDSGILETPVIGIKLQCE